MSKLNEVQQRLSEISPNKFHKLVDSYLSKKYNYSIHSTGTKTGEDKPRKGTPDTLITLENGHYIFVEYTTQKTNIKKKFIDDIKKCLEPKKTSIEISKIDKIILACNSSLQSDDIEALQQACNNIKCEVITNSTLSYDLVNYYPTIAKDFLGIDIGHLLTPNILKEKYLNNFKTISLLTNTPKSIDNIFVNLAIIKEREEKQDKIKLIKREPILNSYEEIHKPKEPIAIKELINISKKSLIYGKAGIGKTTLCKHIAYKWAKGGFYQEFEYIIYLPLREWKNGGIKGAIKDYYYSLDKKELNIDFNAYKILFLFDGYDELDSDKKKDLREEIKKYNLTHYIITTRPYGHQKSDFRVDEYFETIGFSDENVEEYIDAFFKENNNKAKSLKAYLKTNISIKHIGYIPLMLEMICSQWKKEEFNESLTMTELYTQSIENIFFEYTEKNGTAYIQDKEEEIFNYLGKIAFEGLKQQTIVLDKKIIKEKRSFFSDYVLKAGFLNDGKAEKSNPLLNSYQFPHLTFQEYFSALYVSKLKKKKIKKIIQKYKFYPHMQMFFAFLGGLSEDIEDKEFLLQEIESEPKDLVGFYEFKIMNFCIKDMRYKDIEEIKITSFSFKDIMLDCTGIDDKKEIILDSKSYIDSYINSVMNSFVAILLQENIENTIEKDIIKTFFQLEYPFPFIVIYDSLIDTFFKIISNKNIFKKDVRKNIAILLAIFNNKTIESYTTISNRFEKLIKSDKYIKKIYLECDTKRHNKQNISQEKKYNRQNNTFSKSYQNENISEEIILEKIEKYFYRNKEFVFEFSNSEKIVSIKIKNKNKKDKLIAERIIKLEVLSKFIQKNNNLKERFMKYYTENSLDYNIYSIVIDIFIDINEVDFLIDIYKQGEAWTIINHLLSLNNESVAKKIIPLINSNIIESFLDKTKDFQLIIDSLLFYNQNFDITKKIIKFFVEKEMPLYLSKDKHLCTIENGKEISTQREVDEATLNEIKIMLRGDNHYEK